MTSRARRTQERAISRRLAKARRAAEEKAYREAQRKAKIKKEGTE